MAKHLHKQLQIFSPQMICRDFALDICIYIYIFFQLKVYKQNIFLRKWFVEIFSANV